MTALSPDDAYRQFHEVLRRYLARRLKDPVAVDDVLQEVFVRVTRNAQALQAARTPLAWLFTVTRSALIDHQRQVSRAQQLFTDTADTQVDALPGLADEPLDTDFANCLVPLLASLPKDQNQALTYVDLHGGRQTDYAAEHQLTLPAAKARVQRGRARLKQMILSCCSIERDGTQRVMALANDGCDEACC